MSSRQFVDYRATAHTTRFPFQIGSRTIHQSNLQKSKEIASRLSGKRILITGASGFIGCNLIEALKDQECTLIGVSHRESLENDRRKQLFERLDEHRVLDLVNPEVCTELVTSSKPDLIFHLASIVKGARDPALIKPSFEVNLVSTFYLMAAAAEIGVDRFIISGSLEEPGTNETPTSPYACSKACTRLYAKLFNAQMGLDVAYARLGMVYGPWQKDETKLVPHVIRTLLDNKSPQVTSGVRKADWTYVVDVVSALLAIATAESLPDQEVSIGTGRLRSVRDVVETLSDIVDHEADIAFGHKPDRADETENAASVDALEQILGWKPLYTLEQGLRETYHWYKLTAPREPV